MIYIWTLKWSSAKSLSSYISSLDCSGVKPFLSCKFCWANDLDFSYAKMSGRKKFVCCLVLQPVIVCECELAICRWILNYYSNEIISPLALWIKSRALKGTVFLGGTLRLNVPFIHRVLVLTCHIPQISTRSCWAVIVCWLLTLVVRTVLKFEV